MGMRPFSASATMTRAPSERPSVTPPATRDEASAPPSKRVEPAMASAEQISSGGLGQGGEHQLARGTKAAERRADVHAGQRKEKAADAEQRDGSRSGRPTRRTSSRSQRSAPKPRRPRSRRRSDRARHGTTSSRCRRQPTPCARAGRDRDRVARSARPACASAAPSPAHGSGEQRREREDEQHLHELEGQDRRGCISGRSGQYQQEQHERAEYDAQILADGQKLQRVEPRRRGADEAAERRIDRLPRVVAIVRVKRAARDHPARACRQVRVRRTSPCRTRGGSVARSYARCIASQGGVRKAAIPGRRAPDLADAKRWIAAADSKPER